jgi:hypothetical protein
MTSLLHRQRVLWNPTQAKTGLEWGTQPSLPVQEAWSTKLQASGAGILLLTLKETSRMLVRHRIQEITDGHTKGIDR